MTPTRRVESARSDRVLAVRALHGRPGRRKAGLFLAEGPQAVRSALAAGVVIRDLFMDDDAGSAFPDIVRAAADAGVEVAQASASALAGMAETAHPQGVLAVCELLGPGDLEAVMATPGPVVVLDAVSDPGNVGTIIRTADAVAAAAVVLTPESADIHNGKVVRSTAGSLFHLPVLAGHDLAAVVRAAHAAGRTVAVTTGGSGADLYAAVESEVVGDGTVWILGSEAHGASHTASELADLAVRIPMAGRAESLNVAVAAAVVLYAAADKSRLGPVPGRMTD